MGDVAQILGVNNSSRNEKKFLPPPSPASHTIPKSIHNSSVILNNKPVLKVLSSGQTAPASNHSQKLFSTSLPPIVPSHNLPLQTTKRVINREASNSTTTPTQNPSLATSQISFVKINNKAISTKKARSWVFAPFTNSARKDGLKLHHWVRAGVEYPEYPYARFNIHLEELSYRNEVLEIESANQNSNSNAMSIDGISSSAGAGSTAVQNRTEEEINAAADLFYEQHLQHKEWSQSETDTLLEFCRVYQLRWPVIMDRWIGKFGSLSSKKVEDLQHRYYTIGYILNRMKVERAAKVEAENLAKAMAVANQSVSSLVGGVIGGLGGVVGASTSLDDVKENETLKAKHMLSTAIATSSSNAINSLVGEVKSNLQPPVSVPHTGTSNQPTFDLEAERQRRKILDVIWARTKEEEFEEIELRNELKLVEAQIRKMKKSGGHLLAAAAAAASGNRNKGISGIGGVGGGSCILSASSSVADSKPSSRGQSPVPATNVDPTNNTNNATSSTTNPSSLENSNILTTHFAPTPTPGTPYLQSGRQKQPTTNSKLGINKTTLKRMNQVLQELKIEESPLPTKRVCDLYDHVRRDTLILLSLQKIMLKKENEVISRRMRLEKMSNTIVQQQREAAAAAAAAAEAAANASNNAKSSGKNNTGGNNTTTSGANNSGGSSSGNNRSTSGGKASTKAGSSSTTNGKKGSSSSTSSKKGSSKNSSSSGGKNSTKEKKSKKKSEGGTKKRKTSSKKKDSDTSKKAAASASSNNVSSGASVGKSASISNKASGNGVVVETATSTSAPTGTTSGGTGPLLSSSSKTTSKTTSKSPKKNTDSTLDADGKPAKKRVKKNSSTS